MFTLLGDKIKGDGFHYEKNKFCSISYHQVQGDELINKLI